MGCTASKLDNEDTVRRCKERRRFIKDAVFARHHLAAAHADYCRSLRFTGVALSDFAAGEPLLIVSPSTPSVLLHHPPSPSPSSSSTTFNDLPKPPPPPIKTTPLFHPPPPEPSIASSNLPHILSAKSSSHHHHHHHNNNSSSTIVEKSTKVKRTPRLPHILSDSSVSSATATPTKSHSHSFDYFKEGEALNINTTYVGIPNSNYASTPSQASSVWNWDNFYPPPSPPPSDFFNHQESEREEVHCSEWGDDHYTTSTTTSSDNDEDDDGGESRCDTHVDGDDERESRSEVTRSQFGSSSVRSEPVGPPPPLKKVAEEEEEELELEEPSSSRSWKKNVSYGGKEVSEEMRIVVRHKDLKEIVGSLKEYFDKAAAAGDHVSEILETGRAQLDRSFRQLKSIIFSFPSFLFFHSLVLVSHF